jgi:acyl dehydratase
MPALRLTLDDLRNRTGRELAVSDWVVISQDLINQFADVTGDRQWIHVDVDRAARESPFGTTIAHGFLTLSLLSRWLFEAIHIEGPIAHAVNYGLNRVRFPAAIPSGSRVRARFAAAGVEEKPSHGQGRVLDALFHVTVEAEGAEKPCMIADWMVRYYT